MRRRNLTGGVGLFAVPAVLATLAACATTSHDGSVDVRLSDPKLGIQSANGGVGGGGDFGGGSGQWGGGGSLFAGGAGFWSGGGNWAGGSGVWSGGSGVWGGGSGQWSGGGDLFAGGSGWWGGGSGNWNGGGNNWGGGGNWWNGGGSNWGGGGYWWNGGGGAFAGGGSNFSGGSSNWSGGSGLWSGGFATAFPFVGWAGSRQWQFRGVPKAGYQAAVLSTWPTFSGTADTAACPTGQVRLGGFAANFDADGWPGFLALGYSKALCIPTPGGRGLRVQATAGDGSMMGVGGYVMNGDAPTATTSNAQRDAYMLTSLVGQGTGNIATQYGGALCASIGTLAAAKRSCAVGIALSDPNTARDGVTPTVRGVTVKTMAQNGVSSENTPFGRPDGHGLYGETAGDMESYANHAMQEHTSIALPTAAASIDAWNNSNFASSLSMKGSDFAPRALSASANASTLLANINRSLTAPLNMVPVDTITSGTTVQNTERILDMNNSVAAQSGKLYALNLHTLAEQQNPLYGSGGGRWFFHDSTDPAAASKPLLDLSAIYQGSMRFLTGQLSNSAGTLTDAYIADSTIAYADWRPNPTGTFGVDHAGQWPTTIASDSDREARLRGALVLPSSAPNLANGLYHSCAILSAGGAVQCWGQNSFGQLGNGSYINSATPVQVTGLTSGVTMVGGSDYHSCALLSTGAVKCWGHNDSGQLGNGTLNDSSTPVQVTGLTSSVIAVAGGDAYTCVLLSTGAVQCWGDNTSGQLGNGTNTPSLTPVQVSGLTSGVTAIAGGDQHVCALLSTGAVQCWGDNANGQLGNGTNTPSSTPVQVTGLTSGVIAVDASYVNGCAVLATGAVQCWGSNNYGQLGNGSTYSTLDVVQVSGLTSGVIAVALGDNHACALLSTGAVKCWGDNSYGQFGDGTTNSASIPSSTSLFPAATSIAVGPFETCVRTSSGDVRCAGNGSMSFATPAPTGVTSGAVAVAGGTVTTCALLSTGAVKCWGDNGDGQLGNGGYASSSAPVQVSGLTSGVTAITASATHGCALLSTGAVKCWGGNASGELGDGTNTDSHTPVQVSGLTSGVTAITAGGSGGGDHTCALLSTGAVKCWGANYHGQLGNGATDDSNVPVQVSGLTSGVTAISGNYYHTCALLSTGVVKCWGSNYNGQIDSSYGIHTTPVQVPGLTGVTAVDTEENDTCALLSTGAVKCLGYNADGELGNGTTTSSTAPVQVSGLTSGVTAIAAGGSHACAQMSTGALKCWGYNASGQLGNDSFTSSTTPVQVSGLTSGVTAVSGGDDHTCAVISGAVQCWGANDNSQLGAAKPIPTVLSNGATNGALISSQASVLVRKFAAAAGSSISGHVTPIAYTMVNNKTGNQALMVTYDPLAAAAAMFIDQYQAHVDACNRTTSESITEQDQQAGTYLWACSNANAKSAYLSGMAQFLLGAKTYLFGRTDGSASAPCSGATSPSYCIDTTQAHLPYTFVVPNYTSSTFNGDPTVTSGTGAYYYGPLDTALASYRTGIFASNASALHKSLQLAGIAKFDTDTAAVVTTRVKRSGAFGASCTQ